MISLKKASNIAEKLTTVKIPGHSGLRGWSSKGCITGPIEYNSRGRGGGRIGQYHDTLPIQIAVVAELKEKYTLSDIAKISRQIIPQIIQIREKGNLKDKISTDKFPKFKELIIQNYIIDENLPMIEENESNSNVLKKYISAEKKAKKIMEDRKAIMISENFLNIWKEKEHEYENLKKSRS